MDDDQEFAAKMRKRRNQSDPNVCWTDKVCADLFDEFQGEEPSLVRNIKWILRETKLAYHPQDGEFPVPADALLSEGTVYICWSLGNRSVVNLVLREELRGKWEIWTGSPPISEINPSFGRLVHVWEKTDARSVLRLASSLAERIAEVRWANE